MEAQKTRNENRKNIFARKELRIVGTGCYLPEKTMSAEEFDHKQNLVPGTSLELSGVKFHRWAQFRKHESNTDMAAAAGRQACADAGLKLTELDAIIYAAFSYDQPLPCSASLVQSRLELQGTGISCFDVMSTCLSFVTALDLASSLVQTDRYENILIVSSETPSAALNWKDLESSTLFSDGAAAAVVRRTSAGETSNVFLTHHKTYSEGFDYCQIRGGGTNIMPALYERAKEDDPRYLFEMSGKKAFKIARTQFPLFMNEICNTELSLSSYDWIIPHQASQSALNLIRQMLDVPETQFVNMIEDYGNMISASIPLVLHKLKESGKVKRGDRILLLGTSAGFSIGALGFEY